MMNHQQQAVGVLRRVRDLLVERMTDRILQNKDELLEEAIGLSDGGEIDKLHSELGQRLARVDQLLAGLAADQPAASSQRPPAQSPIDPHQAGAVDINAEAFGAHRRHDVVDSPAPDCLALPSPSEVLQLAGPPASVGFTRLAGRILAADADGAAAVLADLFEIQLDRARQCVQVFLDDVQQRPERVARAVQLRRDVQSGDHSAALVLLHDCFGLSGWESISVLQSLRAQLNRKM